MAPAIVRWKTMLFAPPYMVPKLVRLGLVDKPESPYWEHMLEAEREWLERLDNGGSVQDFDPQI
jgi:hypothetical protein